MVWRRKWSHQNVLNIAHQTCWLEELFLFWNGTWYLLKGHVTFRGVNLKHFTCREFPEVGSAYGVTWIKNSTRGSRGVWKRYRRNPISTRNSSFSFIFEKTKISLKLICVVDFVGEIMLSYAKKDHDIAAHRNPLLPNQYPAWDWILLGRRWLYDIVDVQRWRNSIGGLQSRFFLKKMGPTKRSCNRH